jgi:CRP/FNR family cyclic AMP-dependent transcriptional regulator
MRPAAPNPAVLAKTPLFAGLPFAELSRLATLMHHRTFPSRSSVITSGQPGEAVYVILQGSVKVSTIRPDGTEVILAVLGAGEVVGEMSLADSLGRSADVVTLEQSTFLWMDREAFRATVEEVPAMGRNLTQVLSRRLRLANTHSRMLSALDVPGRVAAQILALAREYGEPSPEGGTFIPIPLTQSDLAALIGGSRVRVNQALGHFRRHGAISVDPQHRITVLNEEVLSRRAR